MMEENKGFRVQYKGDTGDGSKATDQYLTGLSLYFTYAGCIVSLLVVTLGGTLVTAIFAAVGEVFGEFQKVGWLVNGFLLPISTLALAYGNISIAFGRKNTMIGGLCFFFIGSLIAAVGKNMNTLIAGRVVQGIGAGVVEAVVNIIFSESVPLSKRTYSIALVATTLSISSIVGPFVGGGFTNNVSWRWCFYYNLPISGACIIILFFFFNPPKPRGSFKERILLVDYFGIFLMTIGVILLLLALTFGGNDFSWSSGAVIACFVLGGVFIIAFVVYNFWFSQAPLIIPQAVSNTGVIFASLTTFFNFAFFITSVQTVAMHFQLIYRASPIKTGVYLLPYSLTVGISSIFTGIFIHFFRRVKYSLMISAITGPIGCGLLTLLGKDSDSSRKIGLLILVGVSAGVQFQSSLLSTQLKAPSNVSGSLITVTALNNFAKSIGGIIGFAIGQMLLKTTSEAYISNLFHTITSDNPVFPIISQLPPKAVLSNPLVLSKLPAPLQMAIIEQLVRAFNNVYYWCLALSLAAFICSIFTTNDVIPPQNMTHHVEDDSDVKLIKGV